MSLHPQQPILSVPENTVHVSQAAFPRGNPYMLLRDEFGAIFEDAGFADLYPVRGQPAYAPWRLALVTLMQFREGLSDRQAAEAVRGRIDWKYLLALDLTDAGFDYSILCEFRGRLFEHKATERLLERVLDAARKGGLLRARSRQRTDSTHVLAAVRNLNRIELLGETLRATLNTIATAAPAWLRVSAPAEWFERYGRRIEDARLPETGAKRDAYTLQVGKDGFCLLDALDRIGTPTDLQKLPEVGILRRVWARHFEREEAGKDRRAPAGVRLRPAQGRGPGDRIESPYDIDAQFRAKSGTNWTGYMAHLSETCEAGLPRLVVHVDTTPANRHEATRTEPIHTALAAKGLTPSEHLVDAAYISAGHLVSARERFGIDLIGPPRDDMSWQSRVEGAFRTTDFTVEWEHHRLRCPEGHMSASWGEYEDKTRGRYIRVGFSPGDCKICPSKTRCTRTDGRGRQLTLHTREEHEALIAARARVDSKAGRKLYAQRQGVESAMAQAACAFGLRQARYRRLAKTHLQAVATAAAIDLDRLAAWLRGRPIAPTRISRFAALAA
jgi:transposase